MSTNAPKRIDNPIPPEFSNVSTLRLITLGVALICLIVTSYATWTVYLMSNRISTYETDIQVEIVSKKVAPVNFVLLEKILQIDSEKQQIQFIPPLRDPFYNQTITSTINSVSITSSTTISTSTLESASSTNL